MPDVRAARRVAWRAGLVWAALLLSGLWSASGSAQALPSDGARPSTMGATMQPAVRRAYYARLSRSPWLAVGLDALFPGAGNVYSRIYVNAAITLGVSLVGAGLWTYGALADHDRSAWAGVALFSAGRLYGLGTAGGGVALYNRVLRRHLGLSARGAPALLGALVRRGWVLRF